MADFVSARGRQVLLFPLYGIARPEDYAQRPHTWVRIAKFGTFARVARAAGCHELVMIGSLVRPAFWQLRFDLTTLMLLPQIAAAFRGGDDHLLSSGVRLIEEQGFRVLGAHEVAPEILVPEGALGHVQPASATVPISLWGWTICTPPVRSMSGRRWWWRDGMCWRWKRRKAPTRCSSVSPTCARAAAFRASTVGGVLVKAPKRGQDRRFDLPSIGPLTVEGVARAGLAGIAVVAGLTIVAEPAQLVQAADRAKIFVVGVAAGTAR